MVMMMADGGDGDGRGMGDYDIRCGFILHYLQQKQGF